MIRKQPISLSSIILLLGFYCATAMVIYLALTTHLVVEDGLQTVRLAIFILLLPIIIKYIVQLLALPVYSWLNYRRGNQGLADDTLVSVLIPAWNEEVGIIKTIDSVMASHHAHFELIVINDGSTDRTHQLISDYLLAYQSKVGATDRIKYLKLSNGGKAKALNAALKMARGEVIITIDADSVMDPEAIKHLLKQFNHEKVGAVAGNVVIGNRRKPIEILQQLEYVYGFFFKRADSVFNSVYIVGGAAAAYRKSVLEDVGGFDQDIITEDIEMSTRILAHGYFNRYAADATIYTEAPSDINGLCRQRLRWKYGRLLTFLKHKGLFFSRCKQHNTYLSFLLLPVALYAEVTLLLEGFLLAIFYAYTIITNDYWPLVIVIGFVGSLLSLQVLFDSQPRYHKKLLLLAPVAWILFYLIDIIEYQALCRSLKRLLMKQNLHWQRWARVGLLQVEEE